MRFTNIMAILLALVVMSTFASAALTVTISAPASGKILYPNMGDDFFDTVFTVVDDVNTPVHTARIRLDDGDTNRTIVADTNLSSNNCTVSVAASGTTYACSLRYHFPTTQGELVGTANYNLDINVTSFDGVDSADGDGDFNTAETKRQAIMVDNRYISAAVETVSSLLPVILILAAIIGIIVGMYGVASGNKIAAAVVGLVVLVVVCILIAIGLGILTP